MLVVVDHPLTPLAITHAPPLPTTLAATFRHAGGTICFALDEIVARGADPSMIRVIALVAAPPALQLMNKKYPGLRVSARRLPWHKKYPGLRVCA